MCNQPKSLSCYTGSWPNSFQATICPLGENYCKVLKISFLSIWHNLKWHYLLVNSLISISIIQLYDWPQLIENWISNKSIIYNCFMKLIIISNNTFFNSYQQIHQVFLVLAFQSVFLQIQFFVALLTTATIHTTYWHVLLGLIQIWIWLFAHLLTDFV